MAQFAKHAKCVNVMMLVTMVVRDYISLRLLASMYDASTIASAVEEGYLDVMNEGIEEAEYEIVEDA